MYMQDDLCIQNRILWQYQFCGGYQRPHIAMIWRDFFCSFFKVIYSMYYKNWLDTLAYTIYQKWYVSHFYVNQLFSGTQQWKCFCTCFALKDLKINMIKSKKFSKMGEIDGLIWPKTKNSIRFIGGFIVCTYLGCITLSFLFLQENRAVL